MTWILVGIAFLLLPLVAVGVLAALSRKVLRLEERVTGLEREMGRRGTLLQAVPLPGPTDAAPPPAPLPLAPIVEPMAADASAPPLPAAAALPPPALASGTRAEVPLPPPKSTPAAGEPATLEQMVGGVWLQNVGSVLVLLGAFFMILWGYTTGRFGPQALVAAGVLAGLGLAWRGARTRRTLPAFGHALIGLGLGIAYVTLFLGYFTLHVLDARVGFLLLTLTSAAMLVAGLACGARTVATLGVLGAFMPQLLAVWLSLAGFTLSTAALLGYMAVVDVAVWMLATRSGWAGLNLAALLLTTVTWLNTSGTAPWSVGVEIALCVLFALFGLAPLPALARPAARVEPVALAVVAAAPAAFLVASWPFLAYVRPATAAMFLFALAAVYLAAAAWIERRREDEKVWRPLTAAASAFLAGALQRSLGSEATALAWCAEGLALVWIGGGRRGSWLRALGSAVALAGALLLLRAMLAGHGWTSDRLPVLYAGGLRSLVSLLLLTWLAALLARRAPADSEAERAWARVVTAGVNLLFMVWGAVEAGHAAVAFASETGRWSPPYSIGEPSRARSEQTLAWALTSAAWIAQAVVLFTRGWMGRSLFMRWTGLALFGITVFKFLVVDLRFSGPFWRFVIAVAVGIAMLAISYLYQRRSRAGRPVV